MKRILIIEDLPDTRKWLVEVVSSAFPGCTIDEAGTRRRGLELCAAATYDLAVVDIGLPDGSGLDVLREILAVNPVTHCVVATVLGDDANIVTALSAGAQGYLLKEQPREILIRQLAQVADGIPALSPPVARRIMEHFRMTGPHHEPDETLTPREREVLTLIARGLRISDAATALGVAEGTVATHIKAIYRKLGISSRAEAALQASRMGLL